MLSHSQVSVGVLVRDVDTLFLDTLLDKSNIFYLVEAQTPTEQWARSFLPESNILRYTFDKPVLQCLKTLEDILLNSNIAKVLQKYTVSGLLVTQVNERIHAWQNQTGIELISVPFMTRQNLENKISFDAWLQAKCVRKPDSDIVTVAELSQVNPQAKVVIQTAVSMGAEGTFIAANHSELLDTQTQLLRQGISSSTPVLVRPFIAGRVLGISTLSGASFQAISGVRVQCYDKSALGGQDIYAGLNWVSDISESDKNKISEVIFHLIQSANADGYWGLLNFDFILNPSGEVFLLECNARYTSATGLTLLYPELMGGYNTNKELLMQHFGWQKAVPDTDKRSFNGLRDSTFAGSVACINFYPSLKHPHLEVRQQKSSGIYRLDSDSIEFVSSDVRKVKDYDLETFFLYTSEAERGEVYSEYVTTGIVVSNKSLFTTQGIRSKIGHLVNEYFCVL